MFYQISQSCEEVFRLNFCTDRVDFVLKFYEIWHLWPLDIGGVGDKHPHDSDHAECFRIYLSISVVTLISFLFFSSSALVMLVG